MLKPINFIYSPVQYLTSEIKLFISKTLVTSLPHPPILVHCTCGHYREHYIYQCHFHQTLNNMFHELSYATQCQSWTTDFNIPFIGNPQQIGLQLWNKDSPFEIFKWADLIKFQIKNHSSFSSQSIPWVS